jgi:translation elongation factor EF-4
LSSNSYVDAGYQTSNLNKVFASASSHMWMRAYHDKQMVFLLNGRQVDALALIVHKSAQQLIGRAWVKKLRKSTRTYCQVLSLISRLGSIDTVIPRQLFEVPIQAVIGKKVIARETLSAARADVTAGLYGGLSTLIILAFEMLINYAH